MLSSVLKVSAVHNVTVDWGETPWLIIGYNGREFLIN